MRNIIKLLATTALLMGFSSASAAWADNNSSEVRLVATIGDSPAFKPVTWEIYRVDNPEGKRYKKQRRHSFTLKSITPGRYRAIVRRAGSVHKRDFYVMADTTSRVHIPVD